MSDDTKDEWIKCKECSTETRPDLADCTCENCGELDWSEPYEIG